MYIQMITISFIYTKFAKFDAIFLFKILVKIGIVSPIINKGSLISIQFNSNNYILYFR
jgi:hypothetical protein